MRINSKDTHAAAIEVEFRVKLTDEQNSIILSQLENLGAKKGSVEKLQDVYYCRTEVKEFSEIEMDKVGSYSLRLRKRDVAGTTQIDLNTKIITNDGDHNSWAEHEVEVDSFVEAERILTGIGYKSFFNLVKERKNFRINNLNIALENIKDFGSIIEVELLTSRENSENAKKEIIDFLSKINISPDQIVPKSITNILMRERSKF